MIDILNTLESRTRRCSVIHGSAGTGKTVLAISLMFELVNSNP
jgi:DNA replication protein DnaC